MRKILVFLSVTYLLFSCAPKIHLLKGNYSTEPYIITSNNSKDVVWDKVIDLFAQKGLPIKIIDRSSGLIISEKSLLRTTVESKDGTLQDNLAWIVVPSKTENNKLITAFGPAYGEWNIRIKNDSEGKCLINVNIVNLQASIRDLNGYRTETAYTKARSTKVFEKTISDLVK